MGEILRCEWTADDRRDQDYVYVRDDGDGYILSVKHDGEEVASFHFDEWEMGNDKEKIQLRRRDVIIGYYHDGEVTDFMRIMDKARSRSPIAA